jgi:DNA repair exonuclease SbcCD nuclease subunit
MILFLGDIHGDFDFVFYYINKNKIENCFIYQVGDFGVGFDKKNDINNLTKLNNFLKERNIVMYVIRGNHDDPKFFNGDFKNYFSNLHLLSDYDVVQIDGFNILGIGGAISIDRKWRKDGVSYWSDELVSFDIEKLKPIEKIDIVVTHTSADFCEPNNKLGFGSLVNSFALKDSDLYDDLHKERQIVTKIWDEIKNNNNPSLWVYGHFHNSHSQIFDGTLFKLLDINEFFDPKLYEIDELNNFYN